MKADEMGGPFTLMRETKMYKIWPENPKGRNYFEILGVYGKMIL